MRCSDSSMDDKDPVSGPGCRDCTGVQIPLWTIRTRPPSGELNPLGGSDSSMDDKDDATGYLFIGFSLFRFLYGR